MNIKNNLNNIFKLSFDICYQNIYNDNTLLINKENMKIIKTNERMIKVIAKDLIELINPLDEIELKFLADNNLSKTEFMEIYSIDELRKLVEIDKIAEIKYLSMSNREKNNIWDILNIFNFVFDLDFNNDTLYLTKINLYKTNKWIFGKNELKILK